MVAITVYADQDLQGTSRVLNLPAPLSLDEPARQRDLLAQVEGLKQKDPVAVATQGNINLLSPGATIDTVDMAFSASKRVLVKANTASSENGTYNWNGPTVAMTRTADADTATELTNALVEVLEGTNAGQNWRQTATITTLETDAVLWSQFGTAPAQATEANTGVAEIATQPEVDAGTDDQRFVTPHKLANYSGLVRTGELTIGDGSATQFDITHNWGTRRVLVQVFRNSAPWDNVLCGVERPDTNTVRVKFSAAPSSNQFIVAVMGR